MYVICNDNTKSWILSDFGYTELFILRIITIEYADTTYIQRGFYYNSVTLKTRY